MNGHQRTVYRRGDKVLIEATVKSWDPFTPFGEVHVFIPPATDPSHMLDGVDAVVPQAIVHNLTRPAVDVSNFYAVEGLYGDDE